MSLFDDADLVFSYSRREALEDGVLVDVTKTAHEAGFRYPVAVTRTVWEQIIEPDQASRAVGQSAEGRLWDVLWMLRAAIRRGPRHTDTLHYQLLVVQEGQTASSVTVRAVCGPDDDRSPCVTVMLPEED